MNVHDSAYIPFHGSAVNLDEWQADARLPLLRGVKDEVVERLADLAANATPRVRAVFAEHEGVGTHLFCP